MLLLAAVSSIVQADTEGHAGAFYITGTITENTCQVSPVSGDFTVPMGMVDARIFSQKGDASEYVPFTIKLENCATVSGVTVTFSGTPDTSDNSLFVLAADGGSSANGLGLGLYNADRTPLPPETASELIPLSTGQSSAVLSFLARYVADSSQVTAGQANSTVTFTLTYA